MSHLAGSVQVTLLRNPRYLHLRLPGTRQLGSLKLRWGQSCTATVHVGAMDQEGWFLLLIEDSLMATGHWISVRRSIPVEIKIQISKYGWFFVVIDSL